MRRVLRLATGLALLTAVGARAQTLEAKITTSPVPTSLQQESPKEIVDTLISRELEAAQHKGKYSYLSRERSERTGGHLWTERVVECPQGRVRLLLAIDGVPLTAQQDAAERARLAEVVKDPSDFLKKEAAYRNDEDHARQMLQFMTKAFLFSAPRMEDGDLRIDYRPNPGYSPSGLEEHVLHGMVGSIYIDLKDMRLHRLDGHLPADVTFGFGLLATIHAGTNFSDERNPVATGEWKTMLVDTHIDGRALFFKTLSKNEHAEHVDFKPVPGNLTLAQAVAMAEEP